MALKQHVFGKKNILALAKVVEPKECNIKISNEKKLYINLGKNVCNERVTNSKLSYM